MIKLVNTVGFIALNKENKILLFKQFKLAKNQNKNIDSSSSLEEWSIPVINIEEDENPRAAIRNGMTDLLGYNLGDYEYFNLYFVDISDNFIKKNNLFL